MATPDNLGKNRVIIMDEALFESKLNELVREISSLPESDQKKVVSLAQKARRYQKDLKKSVSDLQDSLDYLRVTIKYLLFDLEATRRENSYLRKILEEKD